MIKKIGCIEIPVLNIDRAVYFYEKILGLKKTYEHPVWTSFDVGDVRFALAASGTKAGKEVKQLCKSCSLCIFRYIAGKAKRGKNFPNLTSVIYLNVENLDKVYNQLKEQNVKFITEPKEQDWGGKTAIMLDPDNNVIVLSEE